MNTRQLAKSLLVLMTAINVARSYTEFAVELQFAVWDIYNPTIMSQPAQQDFLITNYIRPLYPYLSSIRQSAFLSTAKDLVQSELIKRHYPEERSNKCFLATTKLFIQSDFGLVMSGHNQEVFTHLL